MKTRTFKNQKGYTLIETLFYVSLFAILIITVISSLITMTKSFRATSVQIDLAKSSSVLERISREIRQAESINAMGASDLKLNTKDEFGNNKTVRFALSGTDIQFYEDDVLLGNFNTSNIAVTGLSFSQIVLSSGQAVRVTLSTRSTRDEAFRVEDFYSTAVLRGGY